MDLIPGTRAIRLRRLQCTALLGALSFCAGGLAVFSPIGAAAVGILAEAAYLAAVFAGVPMVLRQRRIRAENGLLHIDSGFLSRRTVCIARRKILGIRVMRTPLNRCTRTGEVSLLTAGGTFALFPMTDPELQQLKQALGVVPASHGGGVNAHA